MHEAFEAMSLVSNPSASRALIRIRRAASRCGAMMIVIADGADSWKKEGTKEECFGRGLRGGGGL